MNISNIFTYGEAHFIFKDSMRLVNGLWESSKIPPHLPKMKREDAFKYYNLKFKKYWKEVESLQRKSA